MELGHIHDGVDFHVFHLNPAGIIKIWISDYNPSRFTSNAENNNIFPSLGINFNVADQSIAITGARPASRLSD